MRQRKSDEIRSRLQSGGIAFNANDSISLHLQGGDLEAIEGEVTEAVSDLLRALVIDTDSDHNTRETARRVAKMFCREVFAGRYQPRPVVTDFPNVRSVDECCVVGPITVRSACSHHLVPITGQAWIGAIPRERVIGLSKFHRLTEWVMARPQIQEEAVEQLADELVAAMNPVGLAVVVRAKHFCCNWRGVRDEGSEMTTSVMRGAFREDGNARREFLALIRGMGY